MIARREEALAAITERMKKRFDENKWRDAISFPTLEEMIIRAHRNCIGVYDNLVAGSDDAALRCAADAANLLALAVQHYSEGIPDVDRPAEGDGGQAV